MIELQKAKKCGRNAALFGQDLRYCRRAGAFLGYRVSVHVSGVITMVV
jgi:hypothetical protein